jgi:predicted nucleic acid-binding protein
MATRPRIYIDSCCFIDLVKHEVGNLPDTANADFWYTKRLLEAHRNEDVEVVTSVLSVGECVAVEKGQATVPTDVQDHFRRLLMSGQYLNLRQTTPRTGMIAQELRWKHGLVFGGPDALHFATAIEAKAVEFITNDARLTKPKVAVVLPALAAAGLRLLRPSGTSHLPDSYRQGDMINA